MELSESILVLVGFGTEVRVWGVMIISAVEYSIGEW